MDETEVFEEAMVYEGLQEVIKDWVVAAPGIFTTQELDRELGVDKATVVMRTRILEELVEEGLIEHTNGRRSLYRTRDTKPQKMAPADLNETSLDIFLPLGIHQLFNFVPGTIMTISGETNAGKTMFLLNAIKWNVKRHKIHYFCSDMDEIEFTMVLQNAGMEWNFNAYYRTQDFEDVIIPGRGNINIIDFLECHDKFYEIGSKILAIHERLRGAVAIISIQKDPKSATGVGGQFTKQKARCCINLETIPKSTDFLCKLTKVKHWAGKAPTDPNGYWMRYKIKNNEFTALDNNWQL